MKRGLLLAGILCIFLLTINLVSAEILVSQVEGVYSIGDRMNLEINVKENSDTEGFLQASLDCDDESIILLHIPLSVKAGEERKIQENLTLTKSSLSGVEGNCNIIVKFGKDETKSQDFEISSLIDIDLIISKKEVLPGEKIVITGTAKKKNLKEVDGFIEIKVGKEMSLKETVKGGKFSSNFSFPGNMAAGEYELEVRVYEKDKNEEISNEGIEKDIIKVRQMPAKIEIAISQQSVVPGQNVSFKVIIYDQANNEIDGDVSVIMMNPYEEIIWKRLVKTDELVVINLGKNETPGYWKIESSASDLNVNRLFYLGENEEAMFSMINDTLIVKNVGNVPYRKAIQIAIGDEVEIEQMDLDLGESRKLRLSAPDGLYGISVTDGKQTFTRGAVSLTGNIIGVSDIRNKAGIINRYPIVWLFLIVVMGLFILTMVERVSKRKLSVYAPSQRTVLVQKPKQDNKKKVLEVGKLETVKGRIEAEHSLILKGNKEESSVISLKTKEIDERARNVLEKIYSEVSEKKGAIFRSGEYSLFIFTPTVTKTFSNPVISASLALEIKGLLDRYNNTSEKKIDYGIGINLGMIIGKLEGNTLKFTSIGNTLSSAKKISDISKSEILASDSFHKKTMSEVRVEKKQEEGIEVYVVKKVSDREKYSEFISDFKKKFNIKDEK